MEKKAESTHYDPTITYMKAIAIVLMVAGHSYINSSIDRFVGLFHMPLFFFVSGYCFKDKHLNNPYQYIQQKMKTIYLPTVKWLISAVLLHNVLLSLGVYGNEIGHEVVSKYSLKTMFYSIIRALAFVSNERIFAGLWFLKMILFASFAGYVILKLLKDSKKVWGGVILLLLFTVIICKLNSYPFGIIVRAYLPTFSTFFFLLGYQVKHNSKILNVLISLHAAPVYLVGLILAYFFWPSSMLSITYITIIPYTITAIMGIMLTMILSKMLKVNHKYDIIYKYLDYLGKNTYSVLMMHIIGFKIVNVFFIIFLKISKDHLSEFPTIYEHSQAGWWILYVIVGVNFPLLMKFVYDKIVLGLQQMTIK